MKTLYLVPQILPDLLLAVVGGHEDEHTGLEGVESHGERGLLQRLGSHQDIVRRDQLQPPGSVDPYKGVSEGDHAS